MTIHELRKNQEMIVFTASYVAYIVIFALVANSHVQFQNLAYYNFCAAMSHLPNAARRRASLEESSPAASPSEVPEISGRDVIVASRLQPAGDGEEAGLATELVQSETIQVSAKAYQRPWAESKAILVESERVETSTREVTAVSEPENAGEEKGGGKLAKVETSREERTREVVVEATREKATGALALVVAESNSCDIEHLVSPSPNRRFRRTITSWIKGGHIGSGSFGSVYEAISE